jgi:protein SCO1
MKVVRFILGMIMVLILPILCFFWVWNKGGDGHVKLPNYFGKFKGLDTFNIRGEQVIDSVWYPVANKTFTNQLGKPVQIFNDLPGKIVVMNFFFSTCKTVCPVLNNNLKFLQTKYKKADSLLHFVSITVDNQTDDVPHLRAYANSFSTNHDKWWFCRDESNGIKNYMLNELKMPDYTTKDSLSDGPIHSNYWVLIDKERNIRGYYNAIDTSEIRNCADDISLLILEKKHTHKEKNNKLDAPLK